MALLIIRPLPAPLFVVLENMGVSSIYGWRRNGWKSASARPIWSAFNGLEGKAKGGEEKSYLYSLFRQNVVSGTISLESTDQILLFFNFPWLCLLYMNCISGTPRPPRSPLFSPSWICLMSLRQNGGFQLSNTNSESLRGRGTEGLFWGFSDVSSLALDSFSQITVFCCPQDVSENVFWSSRGVFPLPCLPQFALLHHR